MNTCTSTPVAALDRRPHRAAVELNGARQTREHAAVALPMALLVITHNEAEKIGRCLDSVTFAVEKLVIDCGSTDATVEIAKAHGARVIHQDWLGFGKQRNFGATQASHDWILYLDADEYLSAELVDEMLRRLPALLASDSAGATLVRASWFMGAPMRWYRPMAREKITRLYHRRRARWRDVRVHESLEFIGRVARFRAPVCHDHNPTLVHRQCKLLRYAELKMLDWRDRGRPTRLWECPFVFAAIFTKDYLLRLAFLDGSRGFVAAFIEASYAVYKRLRYFELIRNPASARASAEEFSRRNLRL